MSCINIICRIYIFHILASLLLNGMMCTVVPQKVPSSVPSSPLCSSNLQVRCATVQPVFQEQTSSDGAAGPRMRGDEKIGGRREQFHAGTSCRTSGLFCLPPVDGPLLGLPSICYCNKRNYAFSPPSWLRVCHKFCACALTYVL